MKRILTFFCLILIGLFFLACDSPTEISEANSSGISGNLTIHVNDNISRTILPELNMDPAYYLVEGSGPNGASFSENTTESFTREDLPVGEWTVTVTAYNASDSAIGSGSASTTVAKNGTAVLNITVYPYSGLGSLDLTVSWVEDLLDDPGIEAVLEMSDGTSRNLEFTVDASQAIFSANDVPAGYHSLIIKLVNGTEKSEITGAVELVRIAEGSVSRGTISFDELNIATGNIIVNITPDMGELLDVSISGAYDSKPENEIMFLTAEVDDYEENFTCVWYINGQAMGYDSDLLFSKYMEIGHYRIDLLVFSADGKKAGNSSVNFEVVEQNLLPGTFWAHLEPENYTIVSDPGYKVTIPFDTQGLYDFDIRWGDGTSEHITSVPRGYLTHFYPRGSRYYGYDISINGVCNGFGSAPGFENYRRGYITEIYQWGDIKLHNKGYQFAFSSRLLDFPAEDSLDLSNVTNMEGMFYGCDRFNGDLSDWYISQVTRTRLMFFECSSFDQDLSAWDTSNVIDMSRMFYQAAEFTNGGNPAGLEDWEVQPGCETYSMFSDCPLSPLPSWYTP